MWMSGCIAVGYIDGQVPLNYSFCWMDGSMDDFAYGMIGVDGGVAAESLVGIRL